VKVIAIHPLANCFDGSFQKELVLDGPVDSAFIHYLGVFGDLQYFPSFPRPFFRVDDRRRFSLQGIEGNSSIKVTLCRDELEQSLRELTQIIGRFDRDA
jgi:hypothetical protein